MASKKISKSKKSLTSVQDSEARSLLETWLQLFPFSAAIITAKIPNIYQRKKEGVRIRGSEVKTQEDEKSSWRSSNWERGDGTDGKKEDF